MCCFHPDLPPISGWYVYISTDGETWPATTAPSDTVADVNTMQRPDAGGFHRCKSCGGDEKNMETTHSKHHGGKQKSMGIWGVVSRLVNVTTKWGFHMM